MRSIRSIEFSDVVIIMVDATQGWESQDMNIFSLAQKNRKGIVILVNKWDLIEDKQTNTMRDFEKQIKDKIGQFQDIPILFTSALTKQRILKAVEVAMQVYEDRKKKIKTSKLNEVMLPILREHLRRQTKENISRSNIVCSFLRRHRSLFSSATCHSM